MQIGFFDSGIGGITVLHQALKFLPNEDYIFYADTAHVPYGEKPKEQVKQYIFDSVDFIVNEGVKAVVIACNTATSVAVEDLRKKYRLPIIGIEPAVKPAVEITEGRSKRVLVLATRLTLNETKFQNLVHRIDDRDIVDTLPLPGLVEFAEKFEFRKEAVASYLTQQLASFDLKQYGTIVLGCTHFPYFKDSLKEVFPGHIDIIDGGVGTAKNLKRILEERNSVNEGTGQVTYYKSGCKVEDEDTLLKYRRLLRRLTNIES
ncbi:glutamate racemase [Aneurinibacillus sp. Ricciae_BoGa-3]|uniref:glutamate racemase n=1 Tax=Aneurinibacillus sp. Ricciae_BoGa-3 TaxID=3022697 RepID=UPI0023413136|nr:glutamate racemase [Aneurinibacillus sp. Ricciae_BoGa-3]WCK55680.1 glutamate racemase [Aneurinibacillus sp. Ricciae_BoGa-3]